MADHSGAQILRAHSFALARDSGRVTRKTLTLLGRDTTTGRKIYNLTENEAGALLHFENGETQQWRWNRGALHQSRWAISRDQQDRLAYEGVDLLCADLRATALVG